MRPGSLVFLRLASDPASTLGLAPDKMQGIWAWPAAAEVTQQSQLDSPHARQRWTGVFHVGRDHGSFL